MNILKEWKYTIIFGFLLVILAFAVRFLNLDSMPIFVDEAIYVRWAQVMRAEPTLRFLPLSDGKQPLYMWLVIPVFKLISDPLIAGRFVSVLTGMGTMFGVFFASFVLFRSKRLSLIASFIYALSPFAVFFDRTALVDSTLSMFGVWTFAFVVLTAKTQRLDMAMITGFLLGGALLTKSPGFFFILLLPSTILLSRIDIKSRDRSKVLLKLSGFWAVSAVIGFGFYNILRLGPNFQLITSRNQDYIYPLTHIFERPFDPLLPFLDRIFEYFWTLGPWVIIVFVVFAIVDNFKKYLKELSVLLVWIMVPVFVVSEFSQTMTARYIYFVLPYVAILAAVAFLPYLRGKKPIAILNFLWILLGVSTIIALNTIFKLHTNVEDVNLPRSERSGFLEEWTSGTGIKEVAGIIESEYLAAPDMKIVVGTEGFFGTLPDGLQVYLNAYPEITVIGVGLDFTKIPSQLSESRDFGNKTYFVVNSSRLKIDPNDLGLVEIAKFKKADRPIGREYVQYGINDYLYLFEVE